MTGNALRRLQRLAVTAVAAVTSSEQQPLPLVVLETTLGDIVIEVDIRRAPITARNFLRYVDAGRYTPGRFYRAVTQQNQPADSVKIEVIQGGVMPERASERFPRIPLERTGATGLTHQDGTVSMARSGPDTASSEFFICIGDQPELDHGGRRHTDRQGFAAFGRVIAGMDVVRRIQGSAAQGQRLDPAVVIDRVERTDLDRARRPRPFPSQPTARP